MDMKFATPVEESRQVPPWQTEIVTGRNGLHFSQQETDERASGLVVHFNCSLQSITIFLLLQVP